MNPRREKVIRNPIERRRSKHKILTSDIGGEDFFCAGDPDQMKILTIAAMTPITPKTRAEVLTNPPLTCGKRAKATPPSPKRIARTAKIIPKIAPNWKLRIAEMSESMEKMLNFFSAEVVVMGAVLQTMCQSANQALANYEGGLAFAVQNKFEMQLLDTFKRKSSLTLIAAGLIIPMIAARAARQAAGFGYQAITKNDPPRNPAHPRVDMQDAIAWTVASGIVGGLARLTARRYLAGTAIPSEGYDLEDEVKKIAD